MENRGFCLSLADSGYNVVCRNERDSRGPLIAAQIITGILRRATTHRIGVTARNSRFDSLVLSALRCSENHRPPKTDADLKFPDYLPDKTIRLQGWLIFHEGKDIRARIRQLQKQP